MKPCRCAVPLLLLFAVPAFADDLPKVAKVDHQPLAAQAVRVGDALELLRAAPLSDAEKKTLADAAKDKTNGVTTIQTLLDKHCLAGVEIQTTDSKPKKMTLRIVSGPAKAELAEEGWRVFLVKVHNIAEADKLELRAESPNAAPLTTRSSGSPDPKVNPIEVSKRFLDLTMFNDNPLVKQLSGLEVEYRIVSIYCRSPGRKEASLAFSLWSDANKNGPVARSEPLAFVFESAPAVLVKLNIKDDDGQSKRDERPVIASFTFKDKLGRIYPAPTRRLAPDFNFHFQIYRGDGETIALQPGTYTVTYTRGPEYLVQQKTITVPATGPHTETFELKRWIHPAAQGWYSGDHHIHAAGCSHYESPTQGVTPDDMMRHVLGEDLNVGCCLSWGPCWYHQKQFFEGKVNPLSTTNHLLRYDVEVSGFPSSHSGHICLLRLREQDYPKTKVIADWPSWDLPIFAWAKGQGAVVGFAHSGWGLDVGPTKELPNYVVPPMNGIGANEYIVDVTQGMCDFISTVDTPSVWELNIWYHTLNCGYRCRISGETDFPCIYGERVGLGRSYVHLDDKLDFDKWIDGIKDGRCYVSDGKSHLMDFTVNGLGVGQKKSEVKLAEPGKVEIKAKVAALLEPKPTAATEKIRKTPLNAKPYWDLERCRIDNTRKVPVEVVVNGLAVDRKEIVADGTEQEVTFSVPIKTSSWVCLRILPSSHTNPVFVLVGDKPIRASKKSAEWCLDCVDKCWQQKAPADKKNTGIRESERPAAQAAFDKARAAYKKIIEETPRTDGERMLILKGHTAPVHAVAYSPDGRYLASGGDDHAVILWDLTTGKALQTLTKHTDCVSAVAFTRQNGCLATGGWDKAVCLWNPHARRKLLRSWTLSEWVWSLAYAPDGWALAAGLLTGEIVLYPRGPKANRVTLTGHSYPVTSLAFSSNSRVLASAGQDRTVRLWTAEFGQPLCTLTNHTDWVRSVAFAPTGDLLASGGDDATIRLWNVTDQRELATLQGHREAVRQVAFSPDGRTLLSVSWDETVRLWDVASRCERGVLNWRIGRVNAVAFAPDGMTAAAAGHDHSAVIWDLEC